MNPIAFKYKLEHFNYPKGVYAADKNVFDTNGNLITEDYFGNGTKLKHYLYQNGIPTVDSDGQACTFNTAGYLIEKTFASLGIHKYTYFYNNLGLMTELKSTKGYSYQYQYDSKNRLSKSTAGTAVREYTYQTNGDELFVFEKDYSNPAKVIETKYTYKNGERIAWNDKPYTNKTDFIFYKDIENQKLEFSVIYTKRQYSYMPLDGCKFYMNNKEVKFLYTKVVNKLDLVIYNPFEKKYYIINNALTEDKDKQKQIFSTVLFNNDSYIDYSQKSIGVNYQGADIQNTIYLKLNSLRTIALENMVVAYDKTLNKTWYGNKTDPTAKYNLVPATEANTNDAVVGVRSENRYSIFLEGKEIALQNASYGYNNEDVIVMLLNQPKYYIPNFRKAKINEVFAGRLFNATTDKILERTEKVVFRRSEPQQSYTQTTPQPQPTNTVANAYNCESGDCINGYGKKNEGNRITEGFFKNSKPNGYGHQTTASGFYQGEFKDGVYNGFGFYFQNLTKEFFIGQWQNGKQNGYGYYKVGDKVTEVGYYQDGKLVTNYMTDDFKNIAYRGNCSGNCVNGFGYLKYSNGDRFMGFFSNSIQVQMGSYYWKNGDWYMGNWENGKRTGQGRLYFAGPKTSYVGNFENGRMEGLGIYMAENGTITQKGNWINGSLSSSTNYSTATTSNQTVNTNSLSAEAREFANSYSSDATSNKINFKTFVRNKENSWINQGKTTEQIATNYASIINELFNNNQKDNAFEIMMKNSSLYNSLLLSKLTPEQRIYIKTKAREITSKYKAK